MPTSQVPNTNVADATGGMADLGDGITCIDALYMRPGLACYYLLQEKDELAVIETGTSLSVDTLLRLMRDRGLASEQVRYVIPTHVHLDHAGGAGVMMREFPQASLVVHPRGARHLADPARLVAGAVAVYGERRFRQLYGEVVPIEPARMVEAADEAVLDLAGRRLLIRDTPGHAAHHFCIWDERTRGWFSGDVFGVSYPELRFPGGDFLLPTTTPVQFDPDRFLASIDLLLDYDPACCYLTHFGRYSDIAVGARLARRQIQDYREIAAACAQAQPRVPELENQLWQYTQRQLDEHGAPGDPAAYRDLLSLDMELNAQGLDVWLSRSPAGG